MAASSCRQLMTIPGIGPLIASAMIAAIGKGAAFAKGPDFAAWLGLVPKQMSTGDWTILRPPSASAAIAIYARCLCRVPALFCSDQANWAKHSFGSWLNGRGKTPASQCFWLLPLPISWRGSPGPY